MKRYKLKKAPIPIKGLEKVYTVYSNGDIVRNWYVCYDAHYNCLDVSSNSYCNKNGIFGLPYFATKEDAQRSIEVHRNEWLTIFGVKEDDSETTQ